MDSKHLLYWVFRAEREHLTERDFVRVAAPDWAWPAYSERLHSLGDAQPARDEHG